MEKRKKYENAKRMDLWKIYEGIAFLNEDMNPFDKDPYEYFSDGSFRDEIRIIQRAIDNKSLKPVEFNKWQVQYWEDNNPYKNEVIGSYMRKLFFREGEDLAEYISIRRFCECYAILEISPFEFLDFVIKKKLFPIPPDLEFIKDSNGNGLVLPDTTNHAIIQQNDVAIICPNDSTIEPTTEQITPEPIQTDPQSWTIHCIGAEWQITFEGQLFSIKNRIPARYMLPLIKQPRKPFGYVKLCQILAGKNIKNTIKKEKKKQDAGDVKDDEFVYEDGLHDQIPTKKHTEEDIQNMKNALRKAYQDYFNHPDQNKDKWAKAKKYGICTNDCGGTLSFSKSKYQGNFDSQLTKALKTVSLNKSRFLKIIKELPSSESLYQHFEQFLKSDKGTIQYAPPDESPLWEIIE